MKQLLILSGKGGTGKTTMASSFIELSKVRAFADCDVEAPNLHLLNHKGEKTTSPFYGMKKSIINQDKCIQCGLCKDHCRFGAIEFDGKYKINEYACEGCSVCNLVCPQDAIEMDDYIYGETTIYRDKTVFSTAELKMGSGNSGKLVMAVKDNLKQNIDENDLVIIDGAPGIGCPVIASMSGVDMVLIVTEPSISGISDLDRIIKVAKNFRVKIVVCINKFDLNVDLTQKIEKHCSDLDIDVVGKVPYDKNILDYINQNKTVVHENFDSSRAIKSIYLNTMDILNR